MSHDFLRNAWYILIGFLLVGYAVLDGFDLGVAVLSPFVARDDKERRLLFSAIGPVWDGNEVWLIAAGAALFAAFPHVYATVFSGFYLALMLVLFGLIGRAVSFEFRSKVESPAWRRAWDWAFFAGSLIPALVVGVAVGNLLRGVPLTADMEYAGTFFSLFTPFTVLVGLTGLAMFATHGANYLALKVHGPVAERARRASMWAWAALVVFAAATTAVAVVDAPSRFDNYTKNPVAWIVPALAVLFLAVTFLSIRQRRAGLAFSFSGLSIAGLLGIWGVANYPYLLPARNVVDYGLTIYNASGSQNNLTAMFIIALIGMPIVLVYTGYIYFVFRGKVSPEDSHY